MCQLMTTAHITYGRYSYPSINGTIMFIIMSSKLMPTADSAISMLKKKKLF